MNNKNKICIVIELTPTRVSLKTCYYYTYEIHGRIPLIKNTQIKYSDKNITCKKLHVCVGIAIALTTVASATTVAYLLIKLV
jgi:hypothetical protein